MAQPNPQTGFSHSAGGAGQPQVAQRQAPSGEKAVNPHPQPQQLQPQQLQSQRVAPTSPQSAPRPQLERQPVEKPLADDDRRGNSDWGLAEEKPGFSRENKFILFVLLVLVAVFSFVVFRNFQKKQAGVKDGEVVAKDGKENKDGKVTAKPKAKDGANLAEDPNGTPSLAENDPFASSDSNTEDPFNSGGPPAQAVDGSLDQANVEAGAGNVAGNELVGSDPMEGSVEVATTLGSEDAGPPDQLQPTETAGAAQAADLFEGPAEQPVSLDEPVAEVADRTSSRGSRRPGRTNHSRPAQIEDIATQPEVITEAPVDQVPSDSNGFEAGADSGTEQFEQPVIVQNEVPTELEQMGGTTTEAQPIQKKATPAVAEVDMGPMEAPSQSFVAQTSPRTTTPRTSPRTATSPRNATSPRGVPTIPPPPLDPADERLGGFREGELLTTPATPRTAGRAPVSVAAGQFDPHSEPLVANHGEYIVRPNDNYWRISRKVYGTARYFQALKKHNEQIAPDDRHMKPGLKISTPSREQLEQHYGEFIPAPAATRPVGAVMSHPNAPKTSGYFMDTDGTPAYRVGPGDTLSSISQKTLGRSSRYDEIHQLNQDRLAGADALTVGAILRLPPDASQTRLVSKPVETR